MTVIATPQGSASAAHLTHAIATTLRMTPAHATRESSDVSDPYEFATHTFVGSGTSIIAAEKTGRVCLALEIDPAYVQVAVSRWEAFTGQSAVRLGGVR